MSAPPVTVLTATPEEEAAIRQAVRTADPALISPGARVAGPEHIAGLVELLSDETVSGPIYDIPRPIDAGRIGAWVARSRRLREAGEALLTVTLDQNGKVAAYSRFTVWPERSSAELAGAQRADRQNSGHGTEGAARSFGFMFEVLGVRLVGLTAATDNIRSARVIEAAGFTPMGERLSRLPDGGSRPSLYWEMTREDWLTSRRLFNVGDNDKT
ncbi:MAG: N-acetyltransferase [Caulobacteraceae bacterium]|nr:MAG: N-acetyltransferase [Caulobacteraceae bacterium]